MDTNFDAAKKFSDWGWQGKLKGKRKIASGPGSSNELTSKTKQIILETIKDHNVKSILDLGCGDWTWMSKIRNKFSEVSYEGWDASENMVKCLNDRYSNENTKFRVKDIVTSEFPDVDLIICRDVLFHLDKKLSKHVTDKTKNCLFISTSYNNQQTNNNIGKYNHIENWGFYKINLRISPFNLDTRELKTYHEFDGRYISLYGPNAQQK